MRHRKLRYANFAGTNLTGAMMTGADLEYADFTGARLFGVGMVYANLRCADLQRSHIRGVDFRETIMDGVNLYGTPIFKAPLQIDNLPWGVCITEDHMQIGCRVHTHEEWGAFRESEIEEMHEDASEFWRNWKTVLLAMCATHRGTRH